jgi:hypothetical protein
MQKVIIYRFSKSPRYENTYDSSTWYEVNKQLDDDDEFYLFREVWELDDAGNYLSMLDSSFVKIVSSKWLENHTSYYGCRVLNDDEYSTNYITDYEKETQGL